MRILITGGAGFLGARLAREILQRGQLAGQTVRELGPFYLVAFLVLALVSYVPASILR